MALLSGPALLAVRQGNGGPPDRSPAGVRAGRGCAGPYGWRGPRCHPRKTLSCVCGLRRSRGEVGVARPEPRTWTRRTRLVTPHRSTASADVGPTMRARPAITLNSALRMARPPNVAPSLPPIADQSDVTSEVSHINVDPVRGLRRTDCSVIVNPMSDQVKEFVTTRRSNPNPLRIRSGSDRVVGGLVADSERAEAEPVEEVVEGHST